MDTSFAASGEITAPADRGHGRFRCRRYSDSRILSAFKSDELQGAAFFKGKSQAFINTIADFFQLSTFMEGDDLMREGDIGDTLFFLHRGKVQILVGPDNIHVATLESGAVIGEMALLGSPTRTATVRAAEFCDCRVLDKHTFYRILKKFPHERQDFLKVAKERMEGLENAKKDHEKQSGGISSRTSRRPLPRCKRSSSFVSEASQKLQSIRQISLPEKLISVRRMSLPDKIVTMPALPVGLEDSSDDEGLSSEEEQISPLSAPLFPSMVWRPEPDSCSTATSQNNEDAISVSGRRLLTSAIPDPAPLLSEKLSLPIVPMSVTPSSFIASSLDNLGTPVTINPVAPKAATYENRLCDLVAGSGSVRARKIDVKASLRNRYMTA
mmetsp:Transcript_46894/g.73180  ORF Transcript_46894/g.73180 Transcript_46894/m.73180 type:complete len:383 (+) Transcript_46894:55-1203(+)